MKRIAALGTVAVLLAGCASDRPLDASAPKPAKTEAGEEYVYQTSLGSRIPRKVRKSEAATTAETTEKSQRWFAEAQERGVAPPHDPTAGR